MGFRIIGRIENQVTIARGNAIREHKRLVRAYGKTSWRKRKGYGQVQLPDGSVRRAELHWYEARGLGKKEVKIKRFLDRS